MFNIGKNYEVKKSSIVIGVTLLITAIAGTGIYLKRDEIKKYLTKKDEKKREEIDNIVNTSENLNQEDINSESNTVDNSEKEDKIDSNSKDARISTPVLLTKGKTVLDS